MIALSRMNFLRLTLLSKKFLAISLTSFDYFLARLMRTLCGLIFCNIAYGKASKEVAKPLRGFLSAPFGNRLSYLTPESRIYEFLEIFIPQW
jgi:hypothetical protein